MKIELVEEIKFGRDPWYSLVLEDEIVFSSWNKEACEQVYNAVINGKIPTKPVRNILKSQEITVSSQENKQTN